MTPSIEFFKGLSEELSNVRLRRNKATGVRSVVMIFEKLQAIEAFNSYRKEFAGDLCLADSEGEIRVTPSSTKFIFGGDEGDELRGVRCQFEIDKDEHWQRFMRFMNRYAEANGMEYGEAKQ